MPQRFDVTWGLVGEINGQPLSVEGSGFADQRTGETQLHLIAAPAFPNGFDPGASQFICNMPLGGFAGAGPAEASWRGLVDRELLVSPARMARIFDAAGEECVRLEALTQMRVHGTTVVVSNQMTGFSRLPAAVEAAWGEEQLLPAGSSEATGVIHFALRLRDGQHLNGLTIVPYRFDHGGLAAPLRRTISRSSCDRLSGVSVSLSSTSEWQPFTQGVATAQTPGPGWQPAFELMGLTR